jgi:hypothetical protein
VLDLGVGGAFLHYDDHGGAGFLSIAAGLRREEPASEGGRYKINNREGAGLKARRYIYA